MNYCTSEIIKVLLMKLKSAITTKNIITDWICGLSISKQQNLI